MRSWTDLFSNDVELSGVDVLADFDALIDPGAAPEHLLLPFLHEATHHWCFTGPVGWAVADLRARSRQVALRRALTGAPDLDQPLAVGTAAEAVTTALLQPFAEGLAVAFESDAVSRQSPFMSDVMLSASSLFGLPRQGDAVEVLSPLQQAIYVQRASARGLTRKLNVYQYPLGDPNGYLLGYLALRGLWARLASRVSRLVEEGDLALAYLRSYVYDDLALVDVMLDADADELTLARRASDHISERFERITEVTASDIDRFEAAAAADQPLAGAELAAALHVDSVAAARGLARLEALHDELGHHVSEPGQVGGFSTADLDDVMVAALNGRDLLYLGRAAVDLDISDSQYFVRSSGNLLRTGTARPGTADGARCGWIDLCFSVRTGGLRTRIVLISDNHRVIASFVDSRAEAAAGRADDIALSRERLRAARQALDDLVNAQLDDSYGGLVLEHLRGQFPTVVESFYANYLPWRGDDITTALTALRAGGLRQFLGGDKTLATALAVVSLNSQMAPMREFAEARLTQQGIAEPTALFDRLLACEERGLGLVTLGTSGVYMCRA